MMEVCRALLLLLNLSIGQDMCVFCGSKQSDFLTACGLRCYTCTLTDPRSCTDTKSCPVIFNRCFSLRAEGYDVVTKGCQSSVACIGAMACCEGDLCNSAVDLKGSSYLLLLLSSGAVALFM